MVWKRKEGDKVEGIANFEGHIDRLIREAHEAGFFDNLSGHGKPLQLDDNPFAGDWGAAYKMVSNAGATLPWIELNNEIIKLSDERQTFLKRAEKTGESMRRARQTHPEQLVWYRKERERQQNNYRDYIKKINLEIERFNYMCPVSSIAKPTLQVRYEMERFDKAWPPDVT